MKNFLTNNPILLYSLFIPLFVIILVNKYKEYKHSEYIAGKMIMELKMSKSTKFFRYCYRTIIIFFVIYFFPQIRRMHRRSGLVDPIYLIISVIFSILFSFVLYNKTQKLCENGILDGPNLIHWTNIKKIKTKDNLPNELILLLYTPVNNCNHIKLYCIPDELEIVRSIVENNISNSLNI